MFLEGQRQKCFISSRLVLLTVTGPDHDIPFLHVQQKYRHPKNSTTLVLLLTMKDHEFYLSLASLSETKGPGVLQAKLKSRLVWLFCTKFGQKQSLFGILFCSSKQLIKANILVNFIPACKYLQTTMGL